MTWNGEKHRHMCSSKGIRTKNDIKVKKEVVGFNFEDDFGDEEYEIQQLVTEKISNRVRNGYTSGDVSETFLGFNAWFILHTEETDDSTMKKISEMIDDGYISGYYPHWYYTVNVWKD